MISFVASSDHQNQARNADQHRHLISCSSPDDESQLQDPTYLSVKCTWWRHQMEAFSALLAIRAGNSPVPGEFPTQRPVTRSFDVFFDQRLNKRLSKQSWGWWFETLWCPLWRHRNDLRAHWKLKTYTSNPSGSENRIFRENGSIPRLLMTISCRHYR